MKHESEIYDFLFKRANQTHLDIDASVLWKLGPQKTRQKWFITNTYVDATSHFQTNTNVEDSFTTTEKEQLTEFLNKQNEWSILTDTALICLTDTERDFLLFQLLPGVEKRYENNTYITGKTLHIGRKVNCLGNIHNNYIEKCLTCIEILCPNCGEDTLFTISTNKTAHCVECRAEYTLSEFTSEYKKSDIPTYPITIQKIKECFSDEQ